MQGQVSTPLFEYLTDYDLQSFAEQIWQPGSQRLPLTLGLIEKESCVRPMLYFGNVGDNSVAKV